MSPKGRERVSEAERREDCVAPVWRVGEYGGGTILCEGHEREEGGSSYRVLALRGLEVFEDCLDRDRDVHVVVGRVQETRVE